MLVAMARSAEARAILEKQTAAVFLWIAESPPTAPNPPVRAAEASDGTQPRGTRPRARLFKLAPTQAYPR